MIIIIDNKQYDTDKSDKIGDNSNLQGCPLETLYRSVKGQLYLNGANDWLYSLYLGPDSNGLCQDSRLMTEAAALDWCQASKVSSENILKHFGSIIEEG